MKKITCSALFTLIFFSLLSPVWADEFDDTRKMFEDARLANRFNNAHGYALFPTIGKAAFVVGGAYGKGRVYVLGNLVGYTSMAQVTLGFQMGGTGYSQVIFFQDQRAVNEFSQGNFEFSAEAEATVLTASASAAAKSSGSSATASGGKNNASISGAGYYKGMETFTITKGGLMAEISIGGQKFSYSAR